MDFIALTMNISDDYTFLQNISVNLNESEYVLTMRGSKYLSLKVFVPVILAYIVIFVTGVIGNVTTCIVIVINPSMRTATNCYLFNLAVSDLLLLILGLPNELILFWELYPWRGGLFMCKLRAYISETSSYVSVITIVEFSLERYWAIYHPLRQYGGSLKRSIRFIVLAWLISFFFALPFGVFINIDYLEYPPRSKKYLNESAICVMPKDKILKLPLYEISCVMFFLLPMLFIGVLYTRICLRIQNNSLSQDVEGSVHGETRQAQSRKTITRMLSAVVITFFICWAPFHIQRIMYVYNVPMNNDVSEWLFPLTGCLYYFSATINPILYNLISIKYRNAFKKTYCCSTSSPNKQGGQSSLRYSSTICTAAPKMESQPMGYIGSEPIESDSATSAQLNEDNDEKEKKRVAGNVDEIISESNVSSEPKKSILIHSRNGRPTCQVSDSETLSNETRI